MKTIPVMKYGKVFAEALVDDEDFDRLSAYRWYPDKDGYARRTQKVAGKMKNRTMHREVLGLEPGVGKVDHRNGNRLDNRRENLRLGTHQQNMHNRRRMSGVGSSQYRGVQWIPNDQKWRGGVMVNGEHHYLGQFDTEGEAAQVVHEFRLAHMPDYEAVDL